MTNTLIDGMQAAIACAPPNVAFIYPDLQYCDDRLKPKRLVKAYAWNYWWARIQTTFDTSACWRRSALTMAGGFNEELRCYDDYTLVLDLSRLGWVGQDLGYPVIMREHDPKLRRSTAGYVTRDGRVEEAVWLGRSVGIVTLFAGRRELIGKWADFISRAALPPKTALYVMDNSRDAAFFEEMQSHCRSLAPRFSHVDVARSTLRFELDPADCGFAWNRHQHIATLYNHVLPRVQEDLVLILEDDVLPPADALQRLSAVMLPNNVSGGMKVGERWRFGIPFSSSGFSSLFRHESSSSFFGSSLSGGAVFD